MKILAVIPARGGSVTIKNKNLKKFGNKPLIDYSIEVAKQVGLIDRVIVSTDSADIIQHVRKVGAEVPFIRPSEFSNSEASMEDVLNHCIDYLKTEKELYDYVVLLLPTSPLRKPEFITECIEKIINTGSDCVMTVNEVPATHTPYWCMVKEEKKGAVFYSSGSLTNSIVRRQDFPQKIYAKNDLVFVFKFSNFTDGRKSIYGNKVELVETPTLYNGDLNTDDEWSYLEFQFSYLKNKGLI